jgi:hypothetical protein
MHARVVRFTDVTSDRVAEIKSAVETQDPPPGIDPTGMELFFDESQGTAVFVGYFATEEKMQEANAAFEAMDASDTPGSRASVDMCEVVVQRSLS